MRYRYVGGTRNLDGIVTRTTGVEAENPAGAKILIAVKFTKLSKRLGFGRTYSPLEIGIVSRREL
jgi:hypothetical protein